MSHVGEKWAAIQEIPLAVWEDRPQREPFLFRSQVQIEEYAEREDVELDHETWQIIEPARMNGRYIRITASDGAVIPMEMLLRVEGTGR